MKMQEAIEKIKALLLFGLACSFIFGAGYTAGRFNLFTMEVWKYNIGMAGTQQVVPSVIDVENRSFAIWQFEENKTHPVPHDEEIKVVLENMSGSLAGYYVCGNELHIDAELDGLEKDSVIGHEFCHLVLTRNGFVDLKAQEQVCYTIGDNYQLLER